MELKEGMYFRTKGGFIDKIVSFESTITNDYVKLEDEYHINKKDIQKTSYNIIDLIEVGDYVNGELVTQLMITTRDEQGVFGLPDTYKCFVKEIPVNSIVTKEQFKNIEYRLEEK